MRFSARLLPLLLTPILSACADLAILASPTNLQNLSTLAQIASFNAHSLSAVEPDKIEVTIIYPPKDPKAKRPQIEAPKDDPRMMERWQGTDSNFKRIVENQCLGVPPGLVPHAAGSTAVALLLKEWGVWLYDQVAAAVKTRVDEFEAKNAPPAYSAKRVVNARANPYRQVECVVLSRISKADSTIAHPGGFVVVLKRVKNTPTVGFSRYDVVYARLDSAVAQTAIAADGSAAPVTVGVSLAISAGRLAGSKPSVIDEVKQIAFPPMPMKFKALLNKAEEVVAVGTPIGCGIPESFKGKDRCPWQSEIVPEPSPTATEFYLVNVNVTEVGSAAPLKKKLDASYEALNAVGKKSYEAWLAAAIKRATQ